MNDFKRILILHNIRSAYNVGAIFRTADAVGISKIYLCGYTPDPLDRFGRERSDIAKSALGAEKNVKWEHEDNLLKLMEKLKKSGVELVAIEQSEDSLDYKKYKAKKHTAFLLGNEVEGIPKDKLEKCDVVLEVPMKGRKESLNVSVCCGVVLFRVLEV